MFKRILLLFSHSAALILGISIGIYILPILTAPASPDRVRLAEIAEQARYRAEFHRDLPGSDLLHWGEGRLAIGPDAIALMGELAPGPDYKLYLAPRFVDNADAFLAVKAESTRIGDVRTFDGFLVPLPPDTDLTAFNTVVVWCETFGKFISAAQYR